MRRSIDMGSSMCEESGGEKERKEAGALRVVLLCHQGLDASDRLLWLLRLLLLGGFHFGCWYVVHYGKNPLIRWIHQLVSSGGLILLSLNYQHKGTKTTVTLLAHMSHHHCWCWSAATPLLLLYHHQEQDDKWSTHPPHLPLLDYTRISHMPLLFCVMSGFTDSVR